jgi:HK97 gp10 family phage protein
MADVQIKGLKELNALLQSLPPKIERNILRGALRAGAKPIQADAKANVAQQSGLLRDGIKISTSAKGGTVTATISTKGKHAYLANWIEFGTNPHRITGPININGAWYSGVDHPGITPLPFMRPALDSQATASVLAAANYIKARLSTKHGIDTADIQIGDE